MMYGTTRVAALGEDLRPSSLGGGSQHFLNVLEEVPIVYYPGRNHLVAISASVLAETLGESIQDLFCQCASFFRGLQANIGATQQMWISVYKPKC